MLANIGQTCLRAAARRFSTTSVCLVYRRRNRENAGVAHRLKALKEDEADIIEKSQISYEDLENLEQDFMEAGEMNEDIQSHMASIKKRQEYKITERVHFRPPKEPNMLTWSEKDQIRILHQSEPEKWTPEALAESFPASPEIIKKILKNKWKPLSAERVIFNDHRVSQNWVEFHQGKLEVHNPRLRAHLTKFVDRKDGVRIASVDEAKKAAEVIMPKPRRTEFLSLVTSYRAENEPPSIESEAKQRLEEGKEDTKEIEVTNSVNTKSKSNIQYTLSQLRSRLENQVEKLAQPSDDIKAIIGSRKPEFPENESLPYVAPSERFKSNAIVVKHGKKSMLQVQDLDNMPNKILIPKDKYKRGHVYRVSDSFYNDKGDFLYRVPGLKP